MPDTYILPTRLGLLAYASFTEVSTLPVSGGDRYALLECNTLYAVALNETIFLVTLSKDAAKLVFDAAVGGGGHDKTTQRISI